MLAYVFWHTAAPGVGSDAYESRLADFHRSLGAGDVHGFGGSATFEVDGATWMAGPDVYEDWYLLDDFAALGRLKEAAVAGARQAPHDSVAAMSSTGAAGIYRLVGGAEPGITAVQATWFDKPAGMPYPELHECVGRAGSLWQRQLVLGPTPELCLLGGTLPAAVEPRTSVSRTPVWPS